MSARPRIVRGGCREWLGADEPFGVSLAAWEIGKLGGAADAPAVPALLSTFTEANSDVGYGAAWALGSWARATTTSPRGWFRV